MSLATLKTKVEQLIEKAQSGSESGAIDYPEWEYTRPAYWLPRPELTLGEDTNEVWALIEVDADVIEHEGKGINNGVIVANGRKQFWKKYTPVKHNFMNVSVNGVQVYGLPPIDGVVEIILNSTHPIAPNYRYQARTYDNLRIISGTMLTDGTYIQDGFMHSQNLCVIDCPVYFFVNGSNSNRLLSNTNIIRPPEFIQDGTAERAHLRYFGCTELRHAGRIDAKILDQTFQNCRMLESVEISANCTLTTTNVFNGCSKLKYLTVDEGFSVSLYIHHSTQFTAEVLHAIIENYADMTGQTAPTFQVGATNLAKIDEEHKAMLEAKNINYL